MTTRKVRFTATAREQLRSMQRWWQENSPRPEILEQDLENAIGTLSIAPGIGSPYPKAGIAGLRRFYIGRLTSHLYYTFEDGEIVIRALWHARRGHGPDFVSPR